MIKLMKWGVSVPSPYVAPEIKQGCALHGVADHHPSPDIIPGYKLQTSMVERGPGRVFTTASGNRYELVGPPDQEWLDMMDMRGFEPDLDNPLMLRRKSGQLEMF